MLLTKTNYLLYRECPQNTWVKIFAPDIYHAQPLSAFDQMIMSTGSEVDELARQLFPGGVLVQNRRDDALTKKLINERQEIIYQPVFWTDKFETIADIIVWNKEKNAYDVYEAKSTNSESEGRNKKKNNDLYSHDLAFQINVLKQLAIPVNKYYIVRLNSEYVRADKLNIKELFSIEDFTDRVTDLLTDVRAEMDNAYDLLKPENKPRGCSCLTKGRSAHCTSFRHLNPEVPAYGVHDIVRIGASPKKLAELVDSRIYSLDDVPEEFELTEIQRNQVDAAQSQKIHLDLPGLAEFLDTVKYPISFLDYETFPAAVPRFAGYRPYVHIPFQFSLHVLETPAAELRHYEFLHAQNTKPDSAFLAALQKMLPDKGSVIVWNKTFESGINEQLAKRNEAFESFIAQVNGRIVDLEDPFKKQFYVHPGFHGKTSIKYVLPTLCPGFSYSALNIREGGTACETWNKTVTGDGTDQEKTKNIRDLLDYCELDTLAMFQIWKHCLARLQNQ